MLNCQVISPFGQRRHTAIQALVDRNTPATSGLPCRAIKTGWIRLGIACKYTTLHYTVYLGTSLHVYYSTERRITGNPVEEVEVTMYVYSTMHVGNVATPSRHLQNLLV